MEERRPDFTGDEQEDNNPAWSEKRGFLRSWLEAKFGSDSETDDSPESEDSSETETPTSRWSRLFRRVFGGTVTREEFSEKPEPEEELGVLTWNPLDSYVPAYEAVPGDNAFDQSEQYEDVTMPYDSEFDQPPEDIYDTATDMETPVTDEPEPLEIDNVNSINPARADREQIDTDRHEIPASGHAKVIAGGAGLVALEYIGRKRADKKIRKEVKQLAKKTDEISADNKLKMAANERLQEQARLLKHRQDRAEKAANRVENKLQDLQDQETRAARSPVAEVVRLQEATKTPDRQQEAAAEPDKETVGTTSNETFLPPVADRLKQQEKILLHREKEVAPDKILHEVVNAAEKDMPIEKVYERRHEIKDEPVASNAASVGSVLNNTLAATGFINSYTRSSSSSSLNTGRTANSGGNQDLYRQAITMGFWAAVIIVGLAFVAYLTIL